MSSRKYIKTKFEGVFYRESSKRDQATGAFDRIYCFWYADSDGKGHWKSVGRHSKGIRAATARTARMKFLGELESGNNPVEREKVTIGNVVDAYVAWAKTEGKHITQPLQQYDKHMRIRLHSVPVATLTPGMLSRIKADLAVTPADLKKPQKPAKDYKAPPARNLSAQTIAHQFAFLRRAVNRAIATGAWSGANPFSSRQGGAWQMPKVDNKRLRFFTPDEAANLLAALAKSSSQLHDMAYLSLKTGMRATEIFRLRSHDVDVHAGILHITAKGGMSEPVYAPEDVMHMLLDYHRKGGEYIFLDRDGKSPLKRISDTFNRVVTALGLDTSGGESRFAVTFHTLRHTFGSWLAQSGHVSLIELKALMRHRTLTMTQRYAHLIPGQERKRLPIIDAMLKSAGKHH